MTDPDLAAAAARLREAERTRTPVGPLTDDLPDLDLDGAYAVQLANVAVRLAEGGVVRGHKVGLTSTAMQEMLGVDQPDFGHLFADMFHPSGSQVRHDAYLAARVEPELAFVLGRDLPTEGCTRADVLAATDEVAASLEIIDSRIRDWQILLEDTVADNASSAGVVLGDAVAFDGALDPGALDVVLEVDGTVVEQGSTAAVLGHPADAVAWLADTLGRRGVALRAGHVVMPGSCTRAVDVAPGTVVRATVGDLPPVEVAFT